MENCKDTSSGHLVKLLHEIHEFSAIFPKVLWSPFRPGVQTSPGNLIRKFSCESICKCVFCAADLHGIAEFAYSPWSLPYTVQVCVYVCRSYSQSPLMHVLSSNLEAGQCRCYWYRPQRYRSAVGFSAFGSEYKEITENRWSDYKGIKLKKIPKLDRGWRL